MRITKTSAAQLALPAGKTDHIAWDDQQPGFGLRIRRGAGGKLLRSWVCQYKRSGRSRRILLGSADLITAERARVVARKVLAEVALGQDPATVRDERRTKDRLTLCGVTGQFLDAKQEFVRKRTIGELRRYLTGPHFKPLHGMPVDIITRRDVASCLIVIQRRHGATSAIRARTALSSMFIWAMRNGLADANPTIEAGDIKSNKARERVLIDQELVDIWNACDRPFGYDRIIKLMILTGCRRQEVGSMTWNEVDLDRNTWTIPAERTKNGRTHTLPLPAMAFDIIKNVPKMARRKQLFGTRGTGFGGWSRCREDLDTRLAGTIKTPWRLHDIRRTVATRMAELGVLPHVIEAVLNHASGHKAGVAGIYNRASYEREVRNALALWSDHVRALVEGGERKILSSKKFKPLAS
jgi:integrase